MAKTIEQLLNELSELEKAAVVPTPDISMSQPWSKELVIILSSSILIFGFSTLLVMAYMIRKGGNADQILRLCALPLIIVAAIFLVVTGYNNEQISPVMGLLGAIAGYLLGSKGNANATSTP